ncbi:adenylate kinase [Pseudomonas frederiksbergensis]|uniref:Adenylate kinase n=1 Tax=Pseudomonas frederiksbergensis TaxID=104087 RepID=A0A1H4S6X0_9PSED|nr:adenylate kinase [Pseudomonas frederiksbergensis]
MMIFVAGVYGVGKTTICNFLASSLGYVAVSASALIKQRRGETTWDDVKRTSDISTNQDHLIQAVHDLQNTNQKNILDGHFALLDNAGKILTVDINVFLALNIDAVLLIEDQPAEILARLNLRDSASWELYVLENLVIAEREGALRFHRESGIPIAIFQRDELQEIVKFISDLESSNKR